MWNHWMSQMIKKSQTSVKWVLTDWLAGLPAACSAKCSLAVLLVQGDSCVSTAPCVSHPGPLTRVWAPLVSGALAGALNPPPSVSRKIYILLRVQSEHCSSFALHPSAGSAESPVPQEAASVPCTSLVIQQHAILPSLLRKGKRP